jgi:hypothetical protein
VQDSDLTIGNRLTLADVLANLKSASIDHLELALEMCKKSREPFLEMQAPLQVWDDLIVKINSEILERTLLK